MNNKTISSILKQHHLRKTPVRVKVLNIFLNSNQALANAHIESEFEYIDRITLYRTLKTFEQKGIIHRAIDGSDTTKYALCSSSCDEHQHHDDHAHFHCEECGKTICLEEVSAPKIKLPANLTLGATHLVINGKCETCN